MESALSRRRVLATGLPALAGSVMFASCTRASRQSAESTSVTDRGEPVESIVDPVAPDSTPPSTGGNGTPTTAPTTQPTTAPTTEPTTAPTSGPTSPPPWSDADFGVLDELIESTNGEALIVVEGGETIHEWYRTDETYARDIASAQKSVLSMLVGRAIAGGHIELDTKIDDVLGTGWTEHGRTAGITVRHLLAMTSGLDNELDVIAAPGKRWWYGDAFAQLFDVLTVTTGRELNDIASEWLFAPAGARTAVFYERRPGPFAGIGLRASVRDLAALGNVVLDPIHPSHDAAWLNESLTSSQSFNLAYGYLWWLNGQPSYRLPGEVRAPTEGPLVPTAPNDLVAALGKDDQKLYVSRELDLVVARLGGQAVERSLAARTSFDAQLWSTLLELRG